MRYSDYSNRIGRGRSYVRHGAVANLQINKGNILALVQGSERSPYKINIKISPLDQKLWRRIKRDCSGKIASLQELITGKFPKSLEDLFTATGDGLFPSPKEINLNCSCPDYASMCKHVAAVLYGIGARLDENPALFFELRDVNINELITEAIVNKSQELIEKSKTKSKRLIKSEDISDMFGIELNENIDTPVKNIPTKVVKHRKNNKK